MASTNSRPDWTGLDQGLDHGSDHRMGHGSDHRKNKIKKKKIQKSQILYKIIITKKVEN